MKIMVIKYVSCIRLKVIVFYSIKSSLVFKAVKVAFFSQMKTKTVSFNALILIIIDN